MKAKAFRILVLILLLVIFVLVAILLGKMLGGCNGCVKDPANTTDPGTKTDDPTYTSTADNTATPTPADNETNTPEPTPEPTPLPLAGVTVYINPGHQGKYMNDKEPIAPWGPEFNDKVNKTVLKTKCTSGTEGAYTHVAEYVVTLQIGLKLKDSLESLGADVVMSRTDHDVIKSNVERAKEANACNADISINIHCNGVDNSSVKGVEVYCRDKGDNTSEYAEKASRDHRLAQVLLDEICNATGAVKRYANRTDS